MPSTAVVWWRSGVVSKFCGSWANSFHMQIRCRRDSDSCMEMRTGILRQQLGAAGQVVGPLILANAVGSSDCVRNASQ